MPLEFLGSAGLPSGSIGWRQAAPPALSHDCPATGNVSHKQQCAFDQALGIVSLFPCTFGCPPVTWFGSKHKSQ
jgi:hypothetical protein